MLGSFSRDEEDTRLAYPVLIMGGVDVYDELGESDWESDRGSEMESGSMQRTTFEPPSRASAGPGCVSTRAALEPGAPSSRLDRQLKHVLGLANAIIFGDGHRVVAEEFRAETLRVANALDRALDYEATALRDAASHQDATRTLREQRRRHALRRVDVTSLLDGARSDVPLLVLAELARADTHREEIWHRPDDDFSLQFFELDDETIWGATGRMLYHLLELVYS